MPALPDLHPPAAAHPDTQPGCGTPGDEGRQWKIREATVVTADAGAATREDAAAAAASVVEGTCAQSHKLSA